LQQIQMESCQPIKISRDKKKKKVANSLCLFFCVTLLSQIHTLLPVTTLVYRSISVGGIPRLDS
jgi:hypothetical protein